MGFVNGFLSYLVLMMVFVAVAGIAIFLGITMRKMRNTEEERINALAGKSDAQS